ncbi:Uu.00g012580.m01.CDS01 [Anthostomella pinea]|uniref:Uu.00g012580.m01.CDS01 n=1 Tax=Anthostomella pinea TaxID=933095 RepID=A0AAI8VYN1_9PEZI|nr:Uu.00g012580.m01.CDS01 [Anthostomella pinea]
MASTSATPSRNEITVVLGHAEHDEPHAMGTALESLARKYRVSMNELVSSMIKDTNGSTILHVAAMNGSIVGHHNEDAMGLASFIDKKDMNGNTAAHMAVAAGQLVAAHHLRTHGASLNAKNNKGWSLLQAAVKNEHLAMTWLLVRGANISATTIQGNTCLHLAAKSDWYMGSKLLLEKGVDYTVRNKHGLQASEVADINCSEAFTGLLMEMENFQPSANATDYDWDAIKDEIDGYFE